MRSPFDRVMNRLSPFPGPGELLQSLYSRSFVPPLNANDGASEYTLGIEVTFDVAGTIQGLWWYRYADSGITSRTGYVFEGGIAGTGANVANGVSTAESGEGWVPIPLGTPYAVTAGPTYMIAVNVGPNESYGYGADAALQVDDLNRGQGAFAAATATRPNSNFGNWYGVDLSFAPD